MRVATAVAPHLRELELTRALRKHPASMTAYDLTLQALDQLGRMERASIERARELLRAGDRDRSRLCAGLFAHGLAAPAMGCPGLVVGRDRRPDRMAAAAARQAIERDRNDPVALAIYGHIQSYLLKDYDIATDYLDRAMAVGPSCAVAWGYSSLTRGYLGDYPEAVGARRKGGPAVAARPRCLLVRALPVAGLLPCRALPGRGRLGAHVGRPQRRERRQPALPDYEPRCHSASWTRRAASPAACCSSSQNFACRRSARARRCAARFATCFRRTTEAGGLARLN